MTVPARLLAALFAADDLHPDPDQARRWAEEELAKSGYQKSVLERFAEWLGDQLDRLFGGNPQGDPGTVPVPNLVWVLALLLVAALVFAVVRVRRRTPAPPPEVDDAVFVDDLLSAQEYRRRARAALDRGDAAGAVVEGFRAVAAQSVERQVLDDARDRTAREFAEGIGVAFTGVRERAADAARLFDEVRYGGSVPSLDRARAVLDLDGALQGMTPTPVDPASLPAPLAVPR